MNTKHTQLTELKSVGSLLNEKTMMVYPMMANGEYFEDEGISIYDDEMNDEWWASLSTEDYQTCTGQKFHSNGGNSILSMGE